MEDIIGIVVCKQKNTITIVWVIREKPKLTKQKQKRKKENNLVIFVSCFYDLTMDVC